MSKKSIIGLVILVASILIAGGSYYFGRYNTKNTVPEVVVGGDKDEHGCVGSAGYSWCTAKGKCLRQFEEFCADSVTELVGAISQTTDVTLISAGNTEFSWFVNQEGKNSEIKIPGVLFVGSGISRTDYEKIEKYLNDTWQVDITNMADGITGGLRGYFVNYMVCTLNFSVAELKNNVEGYLVPINDKVEVGLACGFFNQNNIPKMTTEDKLKEILSEKYNQPFEKTRLVITKQDDTHVTGSISFGPVGTPGGVFLAIKIDDNWQVVFDGNGAVDCHTMETTYNFSADLLQGFCD